MAQSKFNILIVEDDFIQSLLLEKIITSFEYNVIGKAVGGQEAIEKASLLKPDVILMDIMLSDDIDGIQAAIEISKNCKAYIIFLSGNRDNETLARAAQVNFHSFLSKPYKISDLEDAFNSIQLI
jgi:CheY-like chemotaxis protein